MSIEQQIGVLRIALSKENHTPPFGCTLSNYICKSKNRLTKVADCATISLVVQQLVGSSTTGRAKSVEQEA